MEHNGPLLSQVLLDKVSRLKVRLTPCTLCVRLLPQWLQMAPAPNRRGSWCMRSNTPTAGACGSSCKFPRWNSQGAVKRALRVRAPQLPQHRALPPLGPQLLVRMRTVVECAHARLQPFESEDARARTQSAGKPAARTVETFCGMNQSVGRCGCMCSQRSAGTAQ